ncbi:MAG: hypothetical protein MEQ84_11380 [Mesorhizobium sp.]|nr:hypothetical protein [Mesorhizobium sp.]
MAQIFALNPVLMFALFAAFGLVTYLLSIGALAWFGRGDAVTPSAIPVPNFAATITTAWALALGFAAADIWTANSQARLAAAEERSAIARMIGISGSDMLSRPEMVSSLVAYKEAVAGVEWGELRNARPHESVDVAIEEIRSEIVAIAQADTPSLLVGKIIDDFDQLQDARSARLALGQGPRDDYKWYLVLFLTVLSQVALAAVHADRRQGGRRALAIFSIAAAVSLWILALHANPYVGVARIEVEQLRSLPLPGA